MACRAIRRRHLVLLICVMAIVLCRSFLNNTDKREVEANARHHETDQTSRLNLPYKTEKMEEENNAGQYETDQASRLNLLYNTEKKKEEKEARQHETGQKLKLKASPFNINTDFKCKDVKIAGLHFPMCLYTSKEDRWVSGSFLGGAYFEREIVSKLVSFLKQNRDLTFVDLGANLGTYSLPIAHLGLQVVAVEPNPETYRRLAMSINLGELSNIEALNCAIADNTMNTSMDFDSKNRGDSYLLQNGSTDCKHNCPVILTTTLDNLLPYIKNNKKVVMKVDTQESEIKIFTWKAAGKFFEAVDVPMIMMEWDLYKRRYKTIETKRRMVDKFLEFFYNRGYEVYDPRTEKKLSSDWTNWSYDILFKKENLRSDNLFSLDT